MKKYILIVLIFICGIHLQSFSQAIPKNKYGLEVITSDKFYVSTVKSDSSKELIDLEKFINGIVIDVRYATKNNFTGKVLYKTARTFLRLPAANALKKIQSELNKQGLGIKIFDAYRPYSVTEKLWEAFPDDRYAADPRKGSRHNRGCAVDLTLINLRTGEELEMPTPYDDFTVKAHHAYNDLPENILNNRKLLKNIMEKHGFESITSEWWHYDYQGWKTYELLDLPFEEIGK